MVNRDAANAYFMSLSGLALLLTTWISYWFALWNARPPIAWAYTPLLVPEMAATGVSFAIAMAVKSGSYYGNPRLREYTNTVAAVAYGCASVSNAIATILVGMLWFACISDVTSLNFEEYRACDTAQWSLWVQVIVAFLSFLHSVWGVCYSAKSATESHIDARVLPPVNRGNDRSNIERFGDSLRNGETATIEARAMVGTRYARQPQAQQQQQKQQQQQRHGGRAVANAGFKRSTVLGTGARPPPRA